MKKILSVILMAVLVMSVFAGCASTPTTAAPAATTTAETTVASDVDAMTTASIVNEAAALTSALSADGTWIVATLNDLTVDQEIVVDGVFYNKDDNTQDIYRKLALYAQDEDHNITAQYTLTAPKMTVKSENFRIQGGTFKGDVYVEANGFNLGKSATVDGNITFASQEAMDSFSMDESAVLTGEKSFAAVDAMTTASIVNEAAALTSALSADGTWIVATLNDLTVDQDIVVDGVFYNKDDNTQDLYRKLALYAQDEDHNITAQYTLTAPKMTVKSENFRIQGGTFKGDVYVEANGFNLGKSATVDGNIYFASQAAMDSFSMDESAVLTGEKAVQ